MKKKKTKKEILNRRVDRRQFLYGTGGFLALPPLISLMPKTVQAQVESEKVVRSVIYTGSLGINRQLMFPDAILPDLNKVSGELDLYYKGLSDIPGDLSYVLDRANFESLFPYMNVLHGMSLTGGRYQGHNHMVLAGAHSGARDPKFGRTIDVLLENSNSVYPSSSTIPLKALRIVNSVQNSFSWDYTGGKRVKYSGVMGDTNVFNTLFASLSDEGQQTLSRDKINRELLVDKFYQDLKDLENDRRLSKSDKTLLDRYISGVHEINKRLKNSDSQTCTKPSMNLHASHYGNGYRFPWGDDRWGDPNMSDVYDNYIEMIKLAFSCDLTRVVMIENSLWRDRPDGRTGGLHHECPSAKESADRQKWGLLKMRDLAETLRDTQDPLNGSGNLLDNSSILFTNELGDWTTGHNITNMPCVVFGKAGGAFNTGYYVDSRQRDKDYPGKIGSPGRPYKQILQSIMRSMGVTKAEYSQHGDGQGYGEFKEYINQFGVDISNVYTDYRGEHNEVMPFITNI